MLKYNAVRLNITNSAPLPRTQQRQTLRESASPLTIAKKGEYRHSIGMGGSNGRRVLAAMNRSMGSYLQ
jgi:hypothetical protein